MKKYWINEGRHFDISDEMRQSITNAGLNFYKQYEGSRNGKDIMLTREDGVQVTVSYDPTVFVI